MDTLNKTALADETYSVYVAGDSGPSGGPGACAYRIIAPNGEVVEKTRLSEETTSLKATLVGAILALKATPEGAITIVRSNVDYLTKNCVARLEDWAKNNWHKTKGKPLEHADLWKLLFALIKTRTVTFRRVEGDDEQLNNKEVKALARKGAKEADRRYIASLKRGT